MVSTIEELALPHGLTPEAISVRVTDPLEMSVKLGV